MRKLENIPYKDSNPGVQLLDLYLPDAYEFPVFIYFHGGGLESGSKTQKGDSLYSYLAHHGIAVITADYRLYPKAKYPEFIEDAAAVVNWAHKNIPTFGNVKGIFIGGSSAGAYLSQMLCFDKKYLAKYGINSDSMSGYIFNAGQPTTHFNVLRERGLDTRRVIVDEAAPLYHITENRSFSPMMITLSDNDMTGRHEQTMLLIKTLLHFGFEENNIKFDIMENSTHCSYIGLKDENGNYVYGDMILEFIKSVIR